MWHQSIDICTLKHVKLHMKQLIECILYLYNISPLGNHSKGNNLKSECAVYSTFTQYLR